MQQNVVPSSWICIYRDNRTWGGGEGGNGRIWTYERKFGIPFLFATIIALNSIINRVAEANCCVTYAYCFALKANETRVKRCGEINTTSILTDCAQWDTLQINFCLVSYRLIDKLIERFVYRKKYFLRKIIYIAIDLIIGAIHELAVVVLSFAVTLITDTAVIDWRMFAVEINPCAFSETRHTCLNVFILFTYRGLFCSPSGKVTVQSLCVTRTAKKQ